jgi:1-aminocyclopropane-1-carboxylate deaminase
MQHSIPLDHIYTAKLFYAVDDLIKRKKIPAGSRTLIIHSGGLQGNIGFEDRYKIKTPAV